MHIGDFGETFLRLAQLPAALADGEADAIGSRLCGSASRRWGAVVGALTLL